MKRKLVQLLAALLATLVLGYFVLKQLDLRDFLRLWQAADLGLLGVGFAAYLLANLLRALRFRALTGDRLETLHLLRTVFVQNFLNAFLPLRAGEASYLLMVHRTGQVKPGDNLGSLVGARVLDLVTALLIPVITLALSGARSPQVLRWFAAALGVSVLGLAVAIWRAESLADWLRAVASRRQGFLARGLATGSDALRSFTQLRRASLLGRVTALTFGCWALLYLSGYASLIAVGIHVKFWDGLFAYSFPMIASMTPFYMLGGFGVFEGSIGVGLSLVGVPLGTAMAGALLLHLAELTFVVLPAPLGLLRPARRSEQRPPAELE